MAATDPVLPGEADTGTLEELARRADVSMTVGYELANRNGFPIPVFRVGRQFRYSRRAWDALMQAQNPSPRRLNLTEGQSDTTQFVFDRQGWNPTLECWEDFERRIDAEFEQALDAYAEDLRKRQATKETMEDRV